MSLSKVQKTEIIKEYRTHDGDTASPEVQVALITHRLQYLNDHFRSNQKDHHSRQGLLKMVSRRRRLLNYLHKKDTNAYHNLIGRLGIRK